MKPDTIRTAFLFGLELEMQVELFLPLIIFKSAEHCHGSGTRGLVRSTVELLVRGHRAKSGQLATDCGVGTPRPTLAVTSILLSLLLLSLFVCQGKGGQRSTRARGS